MRTGLALLMCLLVACGQGDNAGNGGQSDSGSEVTYSDGSTAADTADAVMWDAAKELPQTDVGDVTGDAVAPADASSVDLEVVSDTDSAALPCDGTCSAYQVCNTSTGNCEANPLCQTDFCAGEPAGMERLEAGGAVIYVDRYEWPNQLGVVPVGGIVSFGSAAEKCASAGKRLCSSLELAPACSKQQQPYPYGSGYDPLKCHTELPFSALPSGSFPDCHLEGLEVFDLVGNLGEWTSDGLVFGGTALDGAAARCAAVTVAGGSYAHPELLGLRCCLAPLDDADADGWQNSLDCAPDKAGVNPAAQEVCNGLDDDCDGQVDDAPDIDKDGYNACVDCNDNSASFHPGAVDFAGDGYDLDCDGVDGTDEDHDGYISTASGGSDCDDRQPAINPGAKELCDGLDNNCDALVDQIPGKTMCDDENPCTDDSCIPASGCVNSPNSAGCDDHDSCTSGDFCQDGQCKPGKQLMACNDSNPCTNDECIAGFGCFFQKLSNIPCDGGAVCAGTGTCVEGVCESKSKCDDGKPCTRDICLDDATCAYAPISPCCSDLKLDAGEECDDGNLQDGDGCDADCTCSSGIPCAKICCAKGQTCSDGKCVQGCTPACTNRTCGPDGCGGSCGTCGAGYSCVEASGKCAATCQPSCTGKTCGPDGCGGSCGTCGIGLSCVESTGKCAAACSDGNPCQCGSDDDCAAREDGNYCNGLLYCNLNKTPPVCELKPGSIVNCPTANDTFCSKNTCKTAVGLCYQTPQNEGQTCTKACTVNPVCRDGTCQGTSCTAAGMVCASDVCLSKVCTPNVRVCDGTSAYLTCNSSGTGWLAPASCGTNQYCEDGQCRSQGCAPGCSDNNVCTSNDQCVDGVCVGQPVVCDDGNACTADSCDKTKGCIFTALNGLACDDKNACTGNDKCTSGLCAGQSVNCDDGNVCTNDSCDKAAGCVHSVNTVPCDDGNTCTTGDVCQSGKCVGGPSGCTCAVDADCAKFDDANYCNGYYWCNWKKTPSICEVQPSSVVVCPPAAVPACAENRCQPSDGICRTAAINEGQACDDGSACTTGDKCSAGACVGSAVVCDDKNACTDDSCDGANGCVHTNNTRPCEDGNPCTLLDFCYQGQCTPGGTAKDCNDNNVCTSETCVAWVGCQYLHAPGTCNDGNACTYSDTCANKVCVGTSYTCTTPGFCEKLPGTCDGKGGCSYAPNTGAACTDNNNCTYNDKCQSSKVCAGTAYSCNSAGYCEKTPGTCNGSGGCSYAANTGATCNDGNACTYSDACQSNKTCSGTGYTCSGHGTCRGDNSCTCDVGFCGQHCQNSGAACL